VIVKTEFGSKLRKRYFGGGTVSAIASDEPWQVYRASLHGRFEDGTLNYMDIVDWI
jgi:molybdenum cofactor sulfurtransferase